MNCTPKVLCLTFGVQFITDRAVMRMLIMVLAVLRGVTPTKWDGHAKARPYKRTPL